MRRRCRDCGKLTKNWQRINGGSYHCYDGCFSTTGWDHRAPDGIPVWYNEDQRAELIILTGES